MANTQRALLSQRSLISVSGVDRLSFLQSLLSNDVSKASRTEAIYAALLTPQGKFLFDLFVLIFEESFLLECEASRAEELIRRLSAYKLRSKVTFENLSEGYDVWALWGEDLSLPLSFKDPRTPELGMRYYSPKNVPSSRLSLVLESDYDTHRLALGICESASKDIEIEKSTLAECNFDQLHGIDWKKGCYIGQELTARMHYRGLAKKRVFPVRIEGTPPPLGAVFDQDSGEMRSHNGLQGLALIKIEVLRHILHEKTPLTYGETRIWPFIPAWMKIDATPTNR